MQVKVDQMPLVLLGWSYCCHPMQNNGKNSDKILATNEKFDEMLNEIVSLVSKMYFIK